MDKIVEKISSYNIFNNVLPGYLFLIFGGNIIGVNLVKNDLFSMFLVAYFVGVVISRLSSIILEKRLDKILTLIYKKNKDKKFVKLSYQEYVNASLLDEKIVIFNQDCNMYRSFCMLIIILLFLKILSLCNIFKKINGDFLYITLLILLLVLFIESYRKQNDYIVKRINIANKKIMKGNL